MSKNTERIERQAMRTVQSVLAGERVGYNNALHWAANWIESSAQANSNPAVIEFAENMAMTFRANFRKEKQEPEPKDEYAGRCRECGARDHKAAECDMESGRGGYEWR